MTSTRARSAGKSAGKPVTKADMPSGVTGRLSLFDRFATATIVTFLLADFMERMADDRPDLHRDYQELRAAVGLEKREGS